MAKKEKLEATAEEKLIGKISGFASSNRKGIIAGAVALVVILVAVLVVVVCLNNSMNSKIDKLVECENAYQEIVDNYSIDTDYTEDYKALIEQYSELVSGNSYVSAKAQYQIGVCYYRLTDYQNAYDAFDKAAEMSEKYYLSSLALMNKAVCAEALDNVDEAKQIYEDISKLEDENGLAPKALFNLGRICYEAGQLELAKTYFEEVATTYSDSEYGKLALNIKSVL